MTTARRDPIRKVRLRRMRRAIARAFAHHDRAAALLQRGSLELAERAGRRALDGLARRLGRHDANVAGAAQTLGAITLARGKLGEAARLARQATSALDRIPAGDEDLEVLRLRCAALRALVLRDRGHYAEAIARLRAAIARAARSLGPDHVEVAHQELGLGSVLKFAGRFAEAEVCYRHAGGVLTGIYGATSDELAPLYHNLGGLAHARGRHAEAERWTRRALAMASARGQALPIAVELAALAPVLDARANFTEAEHAYRRALLTFQRVHGRPHYDIALGLANLGAHHARRDRPRVAARTLRRALAMMIAVAGARHPDVRLIRDNLAIVAASTVAHVS